MGPTTDKNLSLSEAIELGLGHSKKLMLSDAAVEQAEASLQQSKDAKLPDLKLSGAYLYLAQPHLDIKLDLGDNSDDDAGSSDDGSSSSSFPKVHQAVYGMVSASLPLYAGGKITNSIKSAEYLTKATKLDAENDKEEVVQNIISAYYNLYKADAQLRLVNENLKTAVQRVKDFSNLEANGIIARNDLMKAELQQSDMELAVLDAENNRKITNFNFNLLLGLEDSTQIIIDTNAVGTPAQVEGLADLVTMARSNRFDYLATVQRSQAALYNTKAIQGNKYPTVALTGGYMAADIPKALSAYNIVNVGVGVSYDLGALYKNKAKERAAKTQEKILDIRRQKLDDDIQTEIFQAYNNYTHQLKKLDVLQKAIEQAAENYRITKNKYDNALATATELFDADVAQLQARINFANAKADAAVAYNKIYETVGVLNKRVHHINNDK
ncbi:TolC family protein [Arachidicoccus ginsenosidivorans]|uniref:TolC family protein n=1 Tax=Arachidicoccus ginsenosidivorans TaxID=496057 RepID=A0A5B8VRT3_9BACT|nr:TolC family protein [Arachidicoccus ginsenosidivorans]QEC73426.1 TolC family protein [Arachidicoccus ginsenosidivorans]